ncbi:hypothetical protein CDAR_111321 [Caerostris darwini]|uniref:Uncharacterized protein n=1 Tax=Caerostris darwini TaxID=1538125 RepID=A0AAV4UBK8_9ARAC|nr:hypothetical protein CDAR_111321 [Caerostris darwini]
MGNGDLKAIPHRPQQKLASLPFILSPFNMSCSALCCNSPLACLPLRSLITFPMGNDDLKAIPHRPQQKLASLSLILAPFDMSCPVLRCNSPLACLRSLITFP